jgi:hypothetical protein
VVAALAGRSPLAQGGSRRACGSTSGLDDAKDPWLRDNATMRLMQLDALDQIEQ